MAGAGYKFFQTGEVLEASEVNNYLMQQTVMVFADASARTTALSGVLAEGMISYLQDTNKVEVYDGSSWAGYVQLNVANTFTTGTQTINAGGTGNNIGLVVKGQTAQSAKLQEWQNSAGTTLNAIGTNGEMQGSYFGALAGGKAYIQTNFDTNGLGVVTGATTNKGLIIRGAASQTADLQQWQNSAGSVLGYINAGGDFWVTGASRSIFVTNRNNTGSYIDLSTNVVGVYSRLAATVGLVVKGAASQSANLQEWQNSTGTVLAFIASDGTPVTASGVGFKVGGTGVTGLFTVQTGTASTIGAVIRGAASQTADLQQWQNSAGTVNSRVLSDGTFRANIQTKTGHSQFSEFNGGGYIMFNEATASATTGNTDKVAIWVVNGTNANTLKLVARSNGAETTILDNIPRS